MVRERESTPCFHFEHVEEKKHVYMYIGIDLCEGVDFHLPTGRDKNRDQRQEGR